MPKRYHVDLTSHERAQLVALTRNDERATVTWHFSTPDARWKLDRFYRSPSLWS